MIDLQLAEAEKRYPRMKTAWVEFQPARRPATILVLVGLAEMKTAANKW